MSTKRPTLREMRMRKRGGALAPVGGALRLAGQGLTVAQIKKLQKVKTLIKRKQQQGK